MQDAQNGLTEAKEAEAQKTSEIADMQKAVKTHKWASKSKAWKGQEGTLFAQYQ